MTANTTPRLALMSPVNTDDFDPGDFVDTMTKLDGRPGVLPIANYAALPVGLTAAQHGNKYVQMDNGAEWYWWKPTSGSTGTWKRSNALGLIQQYVGSSTVTIPNGPNITVASLPSCPVPGGRAIAIHGTSGQVPVTGGTYQSTLFFLTINGTRMNQLAVVGAWPYSVGAYLDFTYVYNPGSSPVTLNLAITAAVYGGGTSQVYSPITMEAIEL